MKIKFCGATNHVTGSCSWLIYNQTDTQFLVDCGMHQGFNVEYRNTNSFPFEPKKLKFMFLTHAHVDHSGLIPRLYKEGFKGKVFTTRATAREAELILKDAAKISNLFNKTHVDLIQFHCVDDFENFSWGKSLPIDAGIKATFLRSSHILGAASISIAWAKLPEDFDPKKAKTFCFSGDIGCNTDDSSYLPLMKPNKYPFASSDYLLVESTYGGVIRDKHLKSSKNRLSALEQALTDTIIKSKGKVLIPSFSIHRAQEILLDLLAVLDGGFDRQLDILIHSTMIAKANQIYFEELESTIKTHKKITNQYLREDIQTKPYYTAFKELLNTEHPSGKSQAETNFKGHNIRVMTKTPKSVDGFDVIIASSGMCEAGPIVNHLKRLEKDHNNSLILTGFQAKGTKGEELKLNASKNKQNQVMRVIDLSAFYSGHGDQEVILDYIFKLNGYEDQSHPTTVFINHGEKSNKHELLQCIADTSKKNSAEFNRKISQIYLAETKEDWFDLDGGIDKNETKKILEENEYLKKELEKLKYKIEVLNPY